VQDEPLLAEETVSYVGQPIALVVAESAPLARRARRRIGPEIEELQAVTDVRDALRRGQILAPARTFETGDVDRALAESVTVVAGECRIGGQEHVYLETQRARALPAQDGSIRLLSSTQSPYAVQKAVAAVLGIPFHKVEVDVARVGGGFGGKEDQATHWACLAALAAVHTGRPVEIVLSRSDDIHMTGKRHAYVSEFELGLDADGRLHALEIRHLQNAGAFADLSPAVLERTLLHSTGAYHVPNVRIVATSCRTHLPPNTAFRGFGGPQAMFVMECAMAKASEATGIPREELQARNLLSDGDELPYGQVASDLGLRRSWDEAVHTFDLPALRSAVDRYNASTSLTKRGLAVMPVCFGIAFTKDFMNQAGALLHVYGDGSVSVSTGGVEMGQGHSEKIRAIAAGGLGIRRERIRVETTNTRRIANMSPSAASATTDLNGRAVLVAIEQLLERLRSLAASRFGAASGDSVAIRDERIWIDDRPSPWDWESLVREAYLARVPLSAHGFHATPGIHFDRSREKGRPFAYFACGTAIVQVELDVLRGTYEIASVELVHDLGRPIVQKVDLGQIEGGLMQGLGWMSIEDLCFDATGHCLSDTLSTYKIPDVHMVPRELQIRLLEGGSVGQGPFGSKAVGEPPLMYGIGFFFALRDAMRAFRSDLEVDFQAPLTPERVLTQLHSGEILRLARQFPPKAVTSESVDGRILARVE
jgi:xanthine dehydrogenase large subunit